MLEAAAAAIAEDGVDQLSVRGLARATEVSHTAFRHHFGDRRGLLTALGAQGYESMTEAINAVDRSRPDGFLETGVAYIEWALAHPAHFAVMFRPDLVDQQDADLQAALAGLARSLMVGVADFTGRPETGGPETNPLALAAWSLTHGFATLALAGNLPGQATPGGRATLARAVLRNLAGPGRD